MTVSSTAVAFPGALAIPHEPVRTRREASLPERFFCFYVSAIPLLWMLGLTLPTVLVGVFGTALLFVRSQRAIAFALPWLLVAALQLLAVMVNMVAAHQPPWMLVKHLIATYVSGWFLMAGAIAIGASGLIRPAPYLHAVARIGFWAVALALPMYAIAVASGEQSIFVRTPIGLLLPASLPSTSFFFSMLLFNWEDLLGVALPRLSLFAPWTTAMGFCGLCLLFLCLNEPKRRRRRVACACAVFMVLASCSRLAILTLLVTSCVYWLLGRSRAFLAVAGCAGVALACAAVIATGGTPAAAVSRFNDSLKDMRPSASNARDTVHDATMEGIRTSPLIGHGWPGEPLYPDDFPKVMIGDSTMVPGSHSTFDGLAYKAGLPAAVAFVITLALTLALVAWRPHDPAIARTTICLVLAITMTGLGECLDAIAVPSTFAFLWLGIALRQCRVGDRPLVPGAAR